MKKKSTRDDLIRAVKASFSKHVQEFQKFYLKEEGYHGPAPVAFAEIKGVLLRNLGLNASNLHVPNLFIEMPLLEYLNELVKKGKLILSQGQAAGPGYLAQNFFLSHYGYKCWQENLDQVPLDRDSFLSEARKIAPTLNQITLDYLEEGISACEGDLYLAAAVCIGAASENEVYCLLDSYLNYLDSEKKKIREGGLKKKRNLSDVKRYLMDCLMGDGFKTEELEVFDRLEFLIRESRNDAGHPRLPKREESHIKLLYSEFISYLRGISSIRQKIEERLQVK